MNIDSRQSFIGEEAEQSNPDLLRQKLQPVLKSFAARYRLTQRESELLSLIIMFGYTNRELAAACMISEKTVKIHIANTMSKIGASSMRKLLSLLFQQSFAHRQPNDLAT